MEPKFSLIERILTWIVFALVFALILFCGYLAIRYLWPNKFDPNNFWYQQYDPEVFCQKYLKGTVEYLNCQETAYQIAERMAENSY